MLFNEKNDKISSKMEVVSLFNTHFFHLWVGLGLFGKTITSKCHFIRIPVNSFWRNATMFTWKYFITILRKYILMKCEKNSLLPLQTLRNVSCKLNHLTFENPWLYEVFADANTLLPGRKSYCIDYERFKSTWKYSIFLMGDSNNLIKISFRAKTDEFFKWVQLLCSNQFFRLFQ